MNLLPYKYCEGDCQSFFMM